MSVAFMTSRTWRISIDMDGLTDRQADRERYANCSWVLAAGLESWYIDSRFLKGDPLTRPVDMAKGIMFATKSRMLSEPSIRLVLIIVAQTSPKTLPSISGTSFFCNFLAFSSRLPFHSAAACFDLRLIPSSQMAIRLDGLARDHRSGSTAEKEASKMREKWDEMKRIDQDRSAGEEDGSKQEQ